LPVPAAGVLFLVMTLFCFQAILLQILAFCNCGAFQI